MTPLLLDQGLPRRAAVALRQAGWDITHVGELGMAQAQDSAILRRAADEGRTIVTLDSDFAQIIATQQLDAPSVVHLRLQGLDIKGTASLLLRVVPRVEHDLEKGAIVSVTARGYRVRQLPIARPSGTTSVEDNGG